MYRFYENVMHHEFDSVTEFLEYLEKTPINRDVWHHLESEENSYVFSKTKSYEEAVELCRYGYYENFDSFLSLKLDLEKYIKYSNKDNKQYNYYVGYAPDVKAYLEGNPLSMLNRKNPERKQIDIYFNIGVNFFVTESQIRNRGVITLALVELLEQMGYIVGLNLFELLYSGNELFYVKFNFKRKGEKLNIAKLYYAMCHPSFLRRLCFRLEEVTKDITTGWTRGYGSVANGKMVREFIDLKENDILISTPDEMNVNGNDLIDDANNIFDYINNYSKKDFSLEHIKRSRSRKN